ncbi:MAG: hypothetical protein Q8S13_13925 [Dehalococcoidia bacterium]|nr:hypothetical protein [Dehalococcoidia bacterium]
MTTPSPLTEAQRQLRVNGEPSIVALSRFTPGLPNAVAVGLEKGDLVRVGPYGEPVVLLSRLRRNRQGYIGYEARFPSYDSFIPEEWIVWWEGKPEALTLGPGRKPGEPT